MTARIASVAVVAAVACVLGTASPVPLYSSPAISGRDGQIQAPGEPIFDCAGMRAASSSLKAGLPRHDEWIRQTEDMLRAAEDGVTRSKQELTQVALKSARDLAVFQLNTAGKLKELLKDRSIPMSTRTKLLLFMERFQKGGELIEGFSTSIVAGVSFGTAIRQNRATADEFLRQLQDSGISDKWATDAAQLVGPAAELTVLASIAVRDAALAGGEFLISASEADSHREALSQMREAKRVAENKAAELDRFLASSACTPPAPPPSDRIMVTSPSEPPRSNPTPESNPTPKPKSGGKTVKSGGGMSPMTTLTLAAAGTGLAIAGAGLAKQAAKEAETANCDAQETAMMNTVTAMENAANSLAACGTSMTCYNSRLPALQSTWQTAASAAGNYCTCAGAYTQLSASEKEMVQWVWSAAKQMGWNAGTLPSCFK